MSEGMNTADSPAQETRPTRIRWLIFALGCTTSWLLYLHRYTFNIIKPHLAEEYGFSETTLAGLYMLFNFSYGFGQVPSGVLCDYLGTHLFLGSIIAVWSLALAGCAIGGNSLLIGTMRLLFGAGQAAAYPNLSRVTRTWFPRRSRTLIQGVMATFCGRLGGAASSLIMATLLMEHCGLSWRVALTVMSGAGVGFALVFFLLFRESPAQDRRVNDQERALLRDEHEAPVTRGQVLPLRQALAHPQLQLLALQQFLAAGADGIYQSLMGSFFLQRFQVKLGTAGWLVSLPMLGGALGGLTAGWLNDVCGRRWGVARGRRAVGVSGPLLAALLMFVVITQQSPVHAGLALFVVKFFVDWTQPTVWGACTDLGGRCTATVFSMINTTGTMGGLVFPPLFGLILDANTTTSYGAQGKLVAQANYTPLFLTIATMYLLGGLCWLLIDTTKPIAYPSEPESS